MAKAFNSIKQYLNEDDLVTFGKNTGMTWGRLLEIDPSYIVWCMTSFDNPPNLSRELIVQALRRAAVEKKMIALAYKTPTLPRDFEYAPNGSWDDDIPF
jgi:hypothetical protein